MPSLEFEDEVYSMSRSAKNKRLMEMEEEIAFLREHLDDIPTVRGPIALQQGLDHNDLEVVNFLINNFNRKRYSHSLASMAKALEYHDEPQLLKTTLDGLILKGIVQTCDQGTQERYGLNSQEVKSWR